MRCKLIDTCKIDDSSMVVLIQKLIKTKRLSVLRLTALVLAAFYLDIKTSQDAIHRMSCDNTTHVCKQI